MLCPARNSEEQYRTRAWVLSHPRVSWLGSISHLPSVIGWGQLPVSHSYPGTSGYPVCRESSLAARDSQVKGIWKSGWYVTVKIHSSSQVINISFQLLSMLRLSTWLCPLVASFSASYFLLVCLFLFPIHYQLTDSVEFRLPKERNWLISKSLPLYGTKPSI